MSFNTVNPDNFNETMDGYLNRAFDEARDSLRELGLDQEQIEEVESCIRNGMWWAKDMMTMKDAREYKRKY